MNPGRHLGGLGHPGEIALRPRGAETYRLGRLAVVVAHLGRERFIAPVEGSRQRRAEDAEVLLRRVDRHARVYAQEIIQAASVVAMAMGDHYEVELGEIDALRLDVVRKDLGVVAGIEQDALASVFDQCGKSPVFPHRRGLAEGVVEDGDLSLLEVWIRRRLR